MFGINSNAGNGSTPPGAPMVPNSDGVDEPAHTVMQPPMPDGDAASPPPMPEGPAATGQPAPEPMIATAPPVVPPAANDELIKLKQEALQNLAPLVDHLDQTPEERFKTTMMMLQASDNPELVKEAYTAANAITDEKARAQALLDVVNEINYFTQHHGQQPAA